MKTGLFLTKQSILTTPQWELLVSKARVSEQGDIFVRSKSGIE